MLGLGSFRLLAATTIAFGLLGYAFMGKGRAADRPTAQQEQQVRPACVGMHDGEEWARCMLRFKDVRPKHEPTELVFKDWRT